MSSIKSIALHFLHLLALVKGLDLLETYDKVEYSRKAIFHKTRQIILSTMSAGFELIELDYSDIKGSG